MKVLVFLLFFAFPSGSLFSQEFKPEQLVGRWRHKWKEHNVVGEIVSRADGTASFFLQQDGKIFVTGESKWWLEGNRRWYRITRSSLKGHSRQKPKFDTLVKVTKNYYVLRTSKGALEKLVRVKSK